MSAPGNASLPRPVVTTLAVLATFWIGLAIWLPFARLWYPFEVEWMGGAFADHVARILDGEKLYVEPTAEWVPYLYTPLYMYLAAGVSLVFGEGLEALRLTSILASMANLALLFVLVRRRTKSNAAATIACGVWSGCYFLVETWYDAERVDSTFLTFVLGTLCLLDGGRRMRSAALAAGVLVLGYLTKQTALLLAPPFLVFAMIRSPRRGLMFGAVFTALWFVATSWLDHVHDGWFHFYTWQLPRGHEFIFGPFVQFWITDSRPLWPALMLAIWFFARGIRDVGWRETLADGAWWSGLLVAGLASRMHLGGAVNVLMPSWLGLAAMAAFALARSSHAPRPQRIAVLGLVALQLVSFGIKLGNSDQPRRRVGLLDVAEYLPTRASADAGHRLVERLRNADGEVLVPLHGYLPRMAGKRGSAHIFAVIDIRGPEIKDLSDRLQAGFWSSARDREAGLIVLDENLGGMSALYEPGYEFEGRLVTDDQPATFMPVIGLKTRPVMIFRRKP